MAQQDAIGQLKDRFSRQLDDFENRLVVIWHDSDDLSRETSPLWMPTR